MLPFSVSLRSGLPIYEQVIYAVTRAIVSGELPAGETFPSVRALSQELKINPNTAHKIVAGLIDRGLLVVRPGIGTVTAGGRPVTASARRMVLEHETERLVVEARRADLSLQDVLTAIRAHWTRTASRAG
jgi:GntR family transcriptional regulator